MKRIAIWALTVASVTAHALTWTDMASLDALSWDEAFKPKEKK